MSLDLAEQSAKIWWGEISISVGESIAWELGAVSTAVRRLELEWRIACSERDGGEQEQWQRIEMAGEPAGFDDAWERFVYGSGSKPLAIKPALADRPVISRPVTPFSVLPGEEATIYVSTPLWAQFVIDSEHAILKEFPLLPLSDTWFGRSTRQGELCYATSTHARLVLDAMPLHCHRATTAVRLVNEAETGLLLERLSLPAPYLGLYHTGDGTLWTEAIELRREHDDDTAKLDIKSAPNIGTGTMKRLAEPREASEGHILLHAFGRLFG